MLHGNDFLELKPSIEKDTRQKQVKTQAKSDLRETNLRWFICEPLYEGGLELKLRQNPSGN